MKRNNISNNGIPISISMDPLLKAEKIAPEIEKNKKRLLLISIIAFSISVLISFIAKLLVYMIDLFTNIAFYGNFSIEPSSPSHNSLGLFVIIVPAIGGVIVGLMALYGSKAIRGHGIPEAMEQILTNDSKIKPAITFLKPVSAAISIGTGGPFGAEGPIIATGGAFGSTIGQLLKISNTERKILLAAGATAGMSAIFGSPVAAIFLAIELLLFEFSPRSIIPVSIACITGAAGHHLLFGHEPVFKMGEITASGNTALFSYTIIGILIGCISILVTKAVYFVEDAFEKLPVHWMWWPAIGGIAVGIIGYFYPRTLGVGYNNITDILTGTMSVKIIVSLCLFKFLSWAIALGSGTSGGTLAPLLTIGGATGVLSGSLILYIFPHSDISIPLAALVGMSAMFAGASRALLTSIIFALETTLQSNALLPLLGACIASYFVSFFLMENTIMTEKIARRGTKTPDSFEPDILGKINVEDLKTEEGLVLSEENKIGEVQEWLKAEKMFDTNYFIVISKENEFQGIISSSSLNGEHHDSENLIGSLIKRKNISISPENNLRKAVELMAKENIDVLPVISKNNKLTGILTYKDILSVYNEVISDNDKRSSNISLRRNSLKVLIHGQKLMTILKKKNK
jgi:chloride channel protein, CIC family